MVKNRLLRVLLWPVAWLYGVVVLARGALYDWGWLRSERLGIPTLVVGNLAVGGTGKSPMVRDVLKRLEGRGVSAAMLSRGYGRRTRGFRSVYAERSSASEVGDEPLMVARGAAGAKVAVCEDRLRGCKALTEIYSGLQAIVLDDAFQHRRLRGKVNLLLTRYGGLYVDDYPMPVGRLRDTARQARRANAVVVTGCPMGLTEREAMQIAGRLQLREGQGLLFAATEQGTPYRLLEEGRDIVWQDVREVVAMAGIADPKPFFDWLAGEKRLVETLRLRDHGRIGPGTLRWLKQWAAQGRTIVVTEKDAVRLEEAAGGDAALLRQVWVAPIALRWLFDGEKKMGDLLDGLLR